MKKQSKYASFGNYSHGMRHTKFYEVWKGMKARCSNKNSQYYHNYGGRGIVVCDSWLEFTNFYNDMYKSYLSHQSKNKTTTLERTNNNGNYCKENCIWVTRREQANNFRKNVYLVYKGETRTIAEWARIIGVKYMTLYNRVVTRKISVERSLTMVSRNINK